MSRTRFITTHRNNYCDDTKTNVSLAQIIFYNYTGRVSIMEKNSNLNFSSFNSVKYNDFFLIKNTGTNTIPSANKL